MSSEEKIKDAVLSQLGDQIKALQLKLFGVTEAGDDVVDKEESLIKCNNIHLKCLLDVLDHILLYGLRYPDNGYWEFVCEFTHPEVKKQVNGHSDVHTVFDKGRLWIYLALLDSLLGSYLRMFYENQKMPTKYYHRNSFVRDKESLAVIFTLVAGLDLLKFSSELDLSFLGFRDLGLTNVIGNKSSSKNGKKRNDTNIPMQPFHENQTIVLKTTDNGHANSVSDRTIRNEPAITDAVQNAECALERTGEDHNVIPLGGVSDGTGSKLSTDEGSYLDTADWLEIKRPGVSDDGPCIYEARSEDGDSFDEFCHNNDRRSIDSADLINDSTISIVEAEEPPADQTIPRSLAVSDVSSLAEYEGIVLAGFPRRPGLTETLATSGDISLKKTDIEELAMNVFLDKNETFHRMVKGFTGFKHGQLHSVYLLLTDKAMYFLRKQANGSYSCENVVRFRDFKHIEIGLNCQSFAFHAKNDTLTLSTGNETMTRSLISDISSLVVKGLASAAQLTRLVSSTAVHGEAAIKKWLRHALENQTLNLEVLCFSLVHWMCFSGPGSELDTVHFQVIKEGYLDCKSKYLGMVSHWERNYLVLTARGLYQYVQQGDKTPKMMYELNAENCGGCRRVSDEEKKYAFEIISDDGSSVVVLSPATEDQASDWIIKLCQTVAGSSDLLSTICAASKAIPCCLVVTKQNVVTFHVHINNEYHFLSSFLIQDITQILVDNEVRNYCILKFESDHEGMWLFSFTTEYELSKFEHAIAEAWKEHFQADLQFFIIGEGPTRQRARGMCRYIQNNVFES